MYPLHQFCFWLSMVGGLAVKWPADCRQTHQIEWSWICYSSQPLCLPFACYAYVRTKLSIMFKKIVFLDFCRRGNWADIGGSTAKPVRRCPFCFGKWRLPSQPLTKRNVWRFSVWRKNELMKAFNLIALYCCFFSFSSQLYDCKRDKRWAGAEHGSADLAFFQRFICWLQAMW